MNRKKTARKYRYKNRYYSIKELSELSGISSETIRSRIKRGKSVKESVEHPLWGRKQVYRLYKNKNHSFDQLAEISGLNIKALKERLNHGYSIKEAVELPLFARRGYLRSDREAEIVEGLSEFAGISKARVKTLLSKKWSAQMIIAKNLESKKERPKTLNTQSQLNSAEKKAIKALENQWKKAKSGKGALEIVETLQGKKK